MRDWVIPLVVTLAIWTTYVWAFWRRDSHPSQMGYGSMLDGIEEWFFGGAGVIATLFVWLLYFAYEAYVR